MHIHCSIHHVSVHCSLSYSPFARREMQWHPPIDRRLRAAEDCVTACWRNYTSLVVRTACNHTVPKPLTPRISPDRGISVAPWNDLAPSARNAHLLAASSSGPAAPCGSARHARVWNDSPAADHGRETVECETVTAVTESTECKPTAPRSTDHSHTGRR